MITMPAKGMLCVLDTGLGDVMIRGVTIPHRGGWSRDRDVWLLASFERWRFRRWCPVGRLDGDRRAMRETVDALCETTDFRESAERFVAALGLPWEQMRPRTIQQLWGAVQELANCERASAELAAESIEELLALRGLLTREVLAVPAVLAMVNTYRRGVQ